MDGHALLPPGYLETAVAALAETGAADVGGVMAAEGVTPFQQAVAWAMTSKAGVGSAAFHTGGGAGPRYSVYLGVYRREAIEQAGGWDEEMLRAEDWELNYRIRARGGLIWFTPELRVTYRPRASVARPRLASTSTTAAGGGSSSASTRKRPASATWRRRRGGAGRGRPGWPAWPGWRDRGRGAAAGELAHGRVRDPASPTWPGSPRSAPRSPGACPAGVRVRVPLVLGVMHMSWGGGFLTSPRGLHRGAKRNPAVREKRSHEPASRPGENEPWTSISPRCSRLIAATDTSCTAGT